MPRRLRDFIPGFSYHLTQRGNRKASIFSDDVDRSLYLRLLRELCSEEHVKVWAYCLMGNHVHLIVVPQRERALSIAFQRVHGEYARFYNTRHRQCGHVWQGRFKACVLDERHLWNAVRYVERNPVRAGLVARAEEYRWSSARAHCGRCTDAVLSSDLPLLGQVQDWASWLLDNEDPTSLEMIRSRTRTGRPCGSEEFVRKIEVQLGRSLLPAKPGRKPHAAPASAEPEPGQPGLDFGGKSGVRVV